MNMNFNQQNYNILICFNNIQHNLIKEKIIDKRLMQNFLLFMLIYRRNIIEILNKNNFYDLITSARS